MKIKKQTLDRIAELSRLEFKDEELLKIEKDMERILGFVDKLKELDTTGVEPLIYLSKEVNVLREDEAKIVISHDEALKNAPAKDSDFFKVPKVIE